MFKKSLALFLAFVIAYGAPMRAFAFYGSLTPPPGWSQGMQAMNTFRFASAATETSVLLGRIGAKAAITVGAQSVALPVSLRLAPGAALAAARWSFSNPALFAVALAAPVAYQWFKDAGFTVQNGQWVMQGSNPWKIAGSTAQFGSKQDACDSKLSGYPSTDVLTFTVSISGSYCNLIQDYHPKSGAGSNRIIAFWQLTEVLPAPGAPTTYKPATVTDFETAIAPKPLPDAVPKELPQVEWPVELPIVNPDPAIAPSPTVAPISRPIWVPTGDPVMNPNPSKNPDGSPKLDPTGAPVPAQPDTWTQPGTKIKPSPTVDDPWRVDVTPESITKPTATPTPATSDPTTSSPSSSAPSSDSVTCGLPGTPPCKIDETGTPEKVAEDKYKSKLDEYKTKQGELKDKVSGNSDKAFFSGWSSVFTTPPLAQCSPYVLPRNMGSLDPCPVVEGVRSVMAYIWAITALWLSLGMIRRVV